MGITPFLNIRVTWTVFAVVVVAARSTTRSACVRGTALRVNGPFIYNSLVFAWFAFTVFPVAHSFLYSFQYYRHSTCEFEARRARNTALNRLSNGTWILPEKKRKMRGISPFRNLRYHLNHFRPTFLKSRDDLSHLIRDDLSRLIREPGTEQLNERCFTCYWQELGDR